MPELRWTSRGRFVDHGRGFTADGPGVYEVPADAVEEYLNHHVGGWERVDEDEVDDRGDDGAGDENAVDLEDLEYSELQDLAKQHDIPANQSTHELRAALRDADAADTDLAG